MEQQLTYEERLEDRELQQTANQLGHLLRYREWIKAYNKFKNYKSKSFRKEKNKTYH